MATEFIPYEGSNPSAAIDTAIARAALVPDLQTAVAGKQGALTTAQLAAVNSGVTQEDVAAIAGKQDALTTAQLAAANSGIDSTKVAKIAANTDSIAELTDGGAKNLLEMTQTAETLTRYGVTCTYDKAAGTMTLTGSHAGSDSAAIFEFYAGSAGDTRVLPAGAYHLSGCPSGGSTAKYRAVLAPMNVIDTGSGADFTLAEPKYAAYRILISGDCDFTGGLVFRPMVCSKAAWDASHAFEPFRPAYSELSESAALGKAASAAVDLAVKGTKTNLLVSNIVDICSSDANNLPNNAIFGIKVDYNAIANLPAYVYTLSGSSAQNAGSIITFGKEKGRGYGDTQIFVGYGSQTYIRTYAGAWQVWRKLSTARYKRLLGIGDSICEGWRNDGMGFVGMLGVPYTNRGVTGATLGYKEGKTQIYSEMDSISGTYDAVIANGGINDYTFNVSLGNAPTQPAVTAADAEALDKTTVTGGLEYLLYRMITEMPSAQRYFLITHKTKNYPWTANSAGYTQQQLHDRIVQVCKMYNTEVIDIYERSILNSAYSVYVSPTAYSSDHSVTTQYHIDHDGIHPLWLGYFEGYLPIIEQALQTAALKTT